MGILVNISSYVNWLMLLQVCNFAYNTIRSIPRETRDKFTLRELVESLSKSIEEAAAWALLEESSHRKKCSNRHTTLLF